MSTDASDVTPEADAATEETKPSLNLDLKIDSPSACQRHVTVTVSREDIDRYLTDAIDELMPRAEVAGFRPGRAPRKIVEARYKGQVQEQVKGSVLMDSLTQIGEESDFSAISEPEFDFDAVELPDEGPMTFEFDIEVRPEFDMPKWDGMELESPVQEIGEDDVKERTKALLAREGTLQPREGGAEDGDVLDANITFTLDGEELSSLENQTLGVRHVRTRIIREFVQTVRKLLVPKGLGVSCLVQPAPASNTSLTRKRRTLREGIQAPIG